MQIIEVRAGTSSFSESCSCGAVRVIAAAWQHLQSDAPPVAGRSPASHPATVSAYVDRAVRAYDESIQSRSQGWEVLIMCQHIAQSRKRDLLLSSMTTGALALAMAASTAHAEDSPNLLNDPFHVAIGTFIIKSEPTVQLNGETVRGDRVNFDEVIGGGDATRVRLDADWRFGDSERHKLRLIAFQMQRDRSRTIDEQIEWGGDTYPIDANVDAEFKFGVVELAYEYAFMRRETFELGGTIGLHYTTFEASLKAKSTAAGGVLDLSNEASVDAPLPVIGARGLWQLPNHLFVDAQAQFFALSIDEYDGSLQDYRVMLMWQPKSWAGIGIGYNSFRVDVDVDKDTFNGSLDWKYNGPMIFYSASF